MKKILFLLPNLEAGGAERVVLNYTRILDPSKYEMTLIIVNDYGDLQTYIPDHVNLVNLNIIRTRQAYFKLIRTINSIQPEYIFSSTDRTNVLLLMAKAFLLGKPKIIIREPNTPSAQFGENYLNSTYFKLMKFFYPKTDILVAQTEAMKMELLKTFSIPKHKIQVIPNPIDKKFIDDQKERIIESFDHSKINIVASGRLHRQKGFDFLIKAFTEVVRKNDDFRLYIIGKKDVKDNCTAELETLIVKLKLSNHVKLLGFQSNPYPFYKNADLFVLSSRWEGLPNVVLENLYIGTPVVATRCVPVLSELIVDGKNGNLCDFGNIDELAEAVLNYKNYTEKYPVNSSDEQILKLFE
ncbi:MAG: glycosyltransferase [Candidatus Marinimicrobia bacterium]|nr:glycosyltransferase [Candidatus Neomarinimicrobiota bacterium]